MAASLLRWVCSSSRRSVSYSYRYHLKSNIIVTPLPALIPNLLRRAFSEPTRAPSKSSGGEVGKLSMEEAEGSENWELFKSWMLENDRSYESEEEMLNRFQIFCNRVKMVDESNKKYRGRPTFGLTCFADMNRDEVPCQRHLHLVHPRRISVEDEDEDEIEVEDEEEDEEEDEDED